MPFDLASAKIKLGIAPTDTTHDADIQTSLDAALGIVENYLDRKLMRAISTESFFDVIQHTVQLERYPLVRIISSTVKQDEVDLIKGIVHFSGTAVKHRIDVNYEGGYVAGTLPDALLQGLWQVFNTVYALATSSGGTVAAGAISKIVIPDVGSVTYSSGSAAATASSSSPLTLVAYILEPYRRMTA